VSRRVVSPARGVDGTTDGRARARARGRARGRDDDDDDDATIGMPSFTPSTSDAAGCLTALEDVSPSLRVLGAMSFVVSALIGAPQAYKIYARKSSRGVSFWTLALGNVGGFLCVLNLYVLHYDQIKLSGNAFADFKGWARGQPSLLFIWVELANTLSMLIVTPMAYAYVEDSEHAFAVTTPLGGVDWSMKKAVRAGVLLQMVIVACAWAPALIVLHRAGECAPMAWYGNAIGVVVAMIICLKFIPQVKESYENKGSGSLSYLTYGADLCGGLVAFLQKLLVTNERVSTWLPPLILHSLEAYVLGMNAINDKARLGAGAARRDRDADDANEPDEERVQSERLLPRASRGASGATSPRASSPTRADAASWWKSATWL
jgi:uncharacterized protein with PQ loop repeat